MPCSTGSIWAAVQPANGTARLTGEMIRRIVRDLGAKTGLSKPVQPYGLRHQAITRALDLTGGDVRAVARFSPHKNFLAPASWCAMRGRMHKIS